MVLNKGDIVLVEFPFVNLSQTKLRPALVLWASTTEMKSRSVSFRLKMSAT